MKILIIEDEHELAQDVIGYLTSLDYLCELAEDYNQAIDKITAYTYDCVLLDLMIPFGDGLEVLEKMKAEKRSDGVIIISAKGALEDKIKGLQLGADDYLAKPFHLSELSARIFSVIRRKKFDNSNTITHDELTVDMLSKTVTVGSNIVSLTKKEFDLLLLFLGNKNKVISKNALAEHLSGDIADMFDNHDFVYAHVKNLKKKLTEAGCKNFLKTIYGTGYKWEL